MGLLGASDEQHITRATKLGRAVISSDRDFLVIAHDYLDRGMSIPGLFVIKARSSIGDVVRSIALSVERHDQADMLDVVAWVP